MPVPLATYTLTASDLTYLRTVLILDDYAEHTNPLTAVSRYNQAMKRRFVEDATLQLILNRIYPDYRVLIEEVWESKYDQQIDMGDSVLDSTASADTNQSTVILYLLAAEVYEMMLRDRGFRDAVMAVGKDAGDEFALMQSQIDKWRQMSTSLAGEWAYVDVWRY